MSKQENNKMPDGWKMTTLGEAIFPVSETFKFSKKDKVHFLNTGDILDGKLLHNNLSDIAALPGQAKKCFKKGDILYSEIRPANKRYMLVDFDGSNSVASTKLMVLRAKKDVDVRYIYLFLTSKNTLNEFQLIAESRSGTFPQITFESISYFPIMIPSFSEQRAIAAVLSSFDDKIELLREQNKTLEAIAQAIFKEWFINFNFPDQNGKPYKDAGGRMVDSALGAIPAGWREGKLGEEFKIIMGQSPNGESYNEFGSGMIFFQGRTDFQARFPVVRLYTTEPKRIAEKFDVLVSVRAPVGDINIASDKCCIGRGLSAIRSNTKSYLFHKITTLRPLFKRFEAEGTVFGSLGKNDFANIEVVLPPELVIDQFEKAVSPMDQKYFKNYKQIQNLSVLRDILLPKLMQGKVRVNGLMIKS